MSFLNNTIIRKKLMAVAGLIWFSYIIFHALSLLNFHSGEEAFNSFYNWLAPQSFYLFLTILLVLSLLFHVFVALSRQFVNNNATSKYQKSYPKAIPRVLAWGGAAMLLFFIVVHFIDMRISHDDDINTYQHIQEMFLNPWTILFYILGITTLAAHLHHGLTNVLQTFGRSSKQHNVIALIIVATIVLFFASIPISILL